MCDSCFKAPAAFSMLATVRTDGKGQPGHRHKPFIGQVRSVSDDWHRSINGTPYQWVTVHNPATGTNHEWPSNRLTLVSR